MSTAASAPTTDASAAQPAARHRARLEIIVISFVDQAGDRLRPSIPGRGQRQVQEPAVAGDVGAIGRNQIVIGPSRPVRRDHAVFAGPAAAVARRRRQPAARLEQHADPVRERPRSQQIPASRACARRFPRRDGGRAIRFAARPSPAPPAPAAPQRPGCRTGSFRYPRPTEPPGAALRERRPLQSCASNGPSTATVIIRAPTSVPPSPPRPPYHPKIPLSPA